ncbi:SprB repeat-containing protein [Dokdonia sp. PRO95]|uniref:SprB repeat-containing protein n=1 Tax=Dokdonia sp. PRO95 TaxID=1239415 RepID=UPI0005507980|nr:SprB repeat-containing protein [Dokdonia sp. PRO95]
MKNNKLLIILILLLIAGFTVSGQSYSIDYIDVQVNLSCGQTTTNYGDNFNVEVNQIGNSPRGYIVNEIGRATEDGSPCSFNNEFTELKTSTQSLCSVFTDTAGGCCTDYDFEFIMIPNYSILTPAPSASNALPEVTLEMTAGYDPLVYQWEFLHPTTNNWTSFPAEFLGQSSITFNAEDLFGANASSFYEVSIQYRIALCNGWVPPGFPYTYSFIKESPNVEDVVVIDPTCQYNEDGRFTVIFDRPLDDGEQLTNIGIISAGPDNNIANTGDNVFTAAMPPTFSGTGNTYTYPNFLPTGDYILSYQANNTSSAEFSDPFTIGTGPSLAYEITATDISCFNENDGTITITIDPNSSGSVGTPPYKYTINGGAPVNFTGTTTSIQNLGPDNYIIKVFDSNACTERL